MKENKIKSDTLKYLKIAASFFRFYYYTIRRSKKKYDITTNPKEAVMTMFFPVILILLYPFISGLFMPEPLAMGTTFLLIPLFIFNVMYFNHVSNEGYRIRSEEIRRRQEKIAEEARKIREKEIEEYARRNKEREEYIEKLFREHIRQQIENERMKKEALKKASVDQNKLNAMKLMGLGNNPTIEEVKKAFRKLSKIHHPDAGGTQNNFIKLTRAYDYLMKIL